MAKGHRSQIKRERNAQKDTRPSAKLSYARVSVQKACFVLDAVRGKEEVRERAERYRPQLEAYSWALEQVLERPVTRRVLYFLRCGEAVEL